jgi:hypothetical protein
MYFPSVAQAGTVRRALKTKKPAAASATKINTYRKGDLGMSALFQAREMAQTLGGAGAARQAQSPPLRERTATTRRRGSPPSRLTRISDYNSSFFTAFRKPQMKSCGAILLTGRGQSRTEYAPTLPRVAFRRYGNMSVNAIRKRRSDNFAVNGEADVSMSANGCDRHLM